MSLRVLLLYTYYPEFLRGLYDRDPGLDRYPFDEQRRRIFEQGFAVGDAYSHGLRAAGCETHDVILNADALQSRWASEHGLVPSENLPERRRQIVAAQIQHFRPDVVYVFELCPLGDGFLADMKTHIPLLVGQLAAPLHADRTYRPYDLMISSWPPLVDYFRREGMAAEPLRLGFDGRVLERLKAAPPSCDVTFVGGSHRPMPIASPGSNDW